MKAVGLRDLSSNHDAGRPGPGPYLRSLGCLCSGPQPSPENGHQQHAQTDTTCEAMSAEDFSLLPNAIELSYWLTMSFSLDHWGTLQAKDLASRLSPIFS
jgi:hypothetical protein